MGLVSLLTKAWAFARLLPHAIGDARKNRRWERDLPNTAVRLWGGDPQTTQILTVAKHAVFSFWGGGREWILKIAALGERSKESIEAEVEWVEFLAIHEVPVCRPIASHHGEYVERIVLPRHGSVFAFVVEKARGRSIEPGEVADWPSDLIEQWGTVVGRIHAASKQFAPSPRFERREVISEGTLQMARTVLGPRREAFALKLNAVAEAILRLPRERDWFGLVHGDMTPANLFIDGSQLTLYDFESSSYCWFTYDLASPLYSLLVSAQLLGHADPEPGIRFFRSFITGYVRENILPPELVSCLPAFLSFLSLLNLALFYHQKIDKRLKPLLKAVRTLAEGEQFQKSIDFAAIYDEALLRLTCS